MIVPFLSGTISKFVLHSLLCCNTDEPPHGYFSLASWNMVMFPHCRTQEEYRRRWSFSSWFWCAPLQDFTYVVSLAPGSGSIWWSAMPSCQQLPPEPSWTVCSWVAPGRHFSVHGFPGIPLWLCTKVLRHRTSSWTASHRTNSDKFHLRGTTMVDVPCEPQPCPLHGGLELKPGR